MPIETLNTIENLAAGILTLLNQVIRTFADLLFRPSQFAERFNRCSVEASPYVTPYTFLGVTGFLGTKATFVAISATVLILNAFLRAEDTLDIEISDNVESFVQEQMISLPTWNDLLVTAIPLIVCIQAVGALVRVALSRDRNTTLSQSIYYAAGIQYVGIGICALIDYEIQWSNWGLDSVGGIVILLELFAILGWPTILIVLIGRYAVGPSSRRAGYGFGAVLVAVALFASMITASLPVIGASLLMSSNPLDLHKRAVLRVVFVDGYVVADESITIPLIVTNQQQSQVFISSDQVTVASRGGETSAPLEWSGRLIEPGRQADVLSLPPGASVALRFVGKRNGTTGLTVNAAGRLSVMQVAANGKLKKLVAHAWNPE